LPCVTAHCRYAEDVSDVEDVEDLYTIHHEHQNNCSW